MWVRLSPVRGSVPCQRAGGGGEGFHESVPVRRMEVARAEAGVDPIITPLVAWLVNRALDASQRQVVRLLWGDKQQKALRRVVSVAVGTAVDEVVASDDRGIVEEALRRGGPDPPEIGIGDVLALREAVQHLISPRLAVLADQSCRADADRLADAIARKIELGIQLDAARGGPLAPVADLLRHEQLAAGGNRIADAAERGAAAGEEMVREIKEFRGDLRSALSSSRSAHEMPPEPEYRSTLREISARTPQLLGREPELAELAAFATGAEHYRWLTGEAWAGKTALIAEAVTTARPQSVDVVAYFLSRHEGDADSNRFLAAVVPQLAYLLRVDLPDPGLTQFRSLWERATGRAAATGRHTLLVVDGLDEDLRPAGLPSVASLLPSQAGARAHVLVTSRLSGSPTSRPATLYELFPLWTSPRPRTPRTWRTWPKWRSTDCSTARTRTWPRRCLECLPPRRAR
jgi:hypothetical protein